MGLFQQKKQSSTDDDQSRFFDETFREELRNHGRWYFEKVIKENGETFARDLEVTAKKIEDELQEHVTSQLDTAIAKVNTDIRDHVTRQLDEQFVEYSKVMKAAQDVALQSLTHSAHALQEQYQDLRGTLEKSIDKQESALTSVLEENTARVTAMKAAHDAALAAMTESTKALQEQHEQLRSALEKRIADQEATMVASFEDNMAHIIEQYLKEALSDQYDLSSQLPAVIKQLEANKSAIVEDMML